MKKLIRMLGRIRVKFSRSSRRTKTVVICMAALCMVALLTLNLTITAYRNRAEAARQEAARLEYENSQLQDSIDDLGPYGCRCDPAGTVIDLEESKNLWS